MQISKRLAIILASSIAALIVAGTIVIIVALNANTAANQEADYRACVTGQGVYGTTDVDDIAGMADRCYRAVYGE